MTDEKISVEKLTRVYMKIRDKRAEISAAFKQEDEALKAQQDKVKRALLDYCKEHEVESVRTAAGLCYRSVKKRFWTSDWESMHKFVLEHQVPEFLTKSLNQTNVQQFLEENPDLMPPGLNVDSEYTISVRKK
jgi:hypothetical protein